MNRIRHAITFRRWNRNPYQMWMITAMMWVSSSQIYISPDVGAMTVLQRQAQIFLAACNLFGGLIVMAGLHLRDRDTGEWVEMCGAVALVGSMGLYVWTVIALAPMAPNVSFGLGLSEAFVIASCHRGTLIGLDKYRAHQRYRRQCRGRTTTIEEVDDGTA